MSWQQFVLAGFVSSHNKSPSAWERRDMRRLSPVIALISVMIATAGAMAEELNGCEDRDPERRIAACTALIDAPDTTPDRRALAFFRRALSWSQLGQYQRSIPDYDAAIRIAPSFALALNNRANAYQKLGKPSQGLPDIEQALEIAPQEPVFNATRGEIGQALGDREGAMRDHEAAMAFGGAAFVRLYQCSLRLAQLYRGPLDGIVRPELHLALRQCVDQGSGCAPLPPFPVAECPEPVG
jgi:tetratricopeptide (TPR) repeat protein